VQYSIETELFLFTWGSAILGVCIESEEEVKSPSTHSKVNLFPCLIKQQATNLCEELKI